MITVRPSDERGHMDHGWLDTYHTFSFGSYYDRDYMGFRSLRVINEDRVRPGEGFGTHPHNDMEIITYPIAGAIEHRDSTGTSSVVRRGDVQRMSAGTGVTHSEFNHSKEDPLHFLQIWIRPAEKGIAPEYEQKRFDDDDKRGRLRIVASPDGRDGSLSIHQDASLYASVLAAGDRVEHRLAEGRHAWLQVISGAVELSGQRLGAGDGAAISDETSLEITADEDSELILFDLA